MSDSTMTVGDLRYALRDFPDTTKVYFYPSTERGFECINTLESLTKDAIVLSDHGFWNTVYKNPELAGQISIPDFDDHDESGLLED